MYQKFFQDELFLFTIQLMLTLFVVDNDSGNIVPFGMKLHIL